MPVFVDNARIQWRGMLMSHLYADSLDELLRMVDRIGVARKWLQKPPKASWVHFDISEGKRRLAIVYGAIETDKYGPAEHAALQMIATGDPAKMEAGKIELERVEQLRRLYKDQSEVKRIGALPVPAQGKLL